MEANLPSSAPVAQVLTHVRGMKGWMKFLGIMNIIGGGINVLTIVGILWAWLPIWIGIVLLQAGSKAEEYAARGDETALAGFMDKLRSYFAISGIALIVALALSVIWVILVFVLVGVGVFSAGSLLQALQGLSNP